MLKEFNLVRVRVHTGKRGPPPYMVLPNLPLPPLQIVQIEALAVAQYRCKQIEEDTNTFDHSRRNNGREARAPLPVQPAPVPSPPLPPCPPAPGFCFGLACPPAHRVLGYRDG